MVWRSVLRLVYKETFVGSTKEGKQYVCEAYKAECSFK